MRLVGLTIEDFLSIGYAELPLANRGMVLVEGRNTDSSACDSNGSGKSALVEALVWVFYGKTLRDITVDAVIRTGAKKTTVTASFEAGGQSYRVERYRGDAGNGLRLYGADEDDLTCQDMADTQKRLVEILGIDYVTFCNAVVYGKAELHRFTSAGDADRKKILESLLGVDLYERCHEVAKARAAAAKQRQEYLARDFSSNDAAIEETKGQITETRTKAASWEEERQQRLVLLERQSEGYSEASSQLQKAHADRQKLDNRIHQLQEQRLTIQRTSSDKVAELTQPAAQLQAEINHLQSHVRSMEELSDAPCPTCQQVVSPEYVGGITEDAKNKVAALEEEYKAAAKAVVDARAAASREQQRVDLDARKARSERELLEANYSRLHSEVSAMERARTEHAALAKQESPYEVALSQTKERLTKALAKRKLLETSVLEVNQRLRTAQFWVDAFGRQGIRSYLLDSVVPRLNERVAELTEVLTAGDITLEFSTQTKLKSGATSEKFSLGVVNRFGADTYGGNSEGEQRRVDLCVLFALHELARSRIGDLNILFLDETGAERVVEFLQQIVQEHNLESVFVITHSAALAPLFEQRTVIQKSGGVSCLVEE